MAKPAQQHPGLLLYDCYRLFRQCLTYHMQDLALSEAQWRVLGNVSSMPGISQSQLATLLGIGKAPLGNLVDKLETEGLLQRVPAAQDRRRKCLFATSKAEPVTNTLRKRYQDLEKVFMGGISHRQQVILKQNLQQVHANLTALSQTGEHELATERLALMHLLGGISRLNSRHFDLQLKEMGFTRSQWLVLDAISREEIIQQNELAIRLNMNKAPLGVLIEHLENGGWVQRRVHPQDRRARQLYLSTGCRQQMDSLVASFEELHKRTLQGISETRCQQLGQCLKKMRRNLQNIASQQQSPPPNGART